MKNVKITVFTVVCVLFSVAIYQSCIYNDQTNKFQLTVEPQPLPSVVEGFSFPVDSGTILSWLDSYDTTSITQHAWGLWAGLTTNSSQIFKGDTLLVYETWLGISDIATACASGDTASGCGQTKSVRERLHFPNQLKHNFGVKQAVSADTATNLFVSVSYDPNAACFATKNLLLNQSTINKYAVNGGIGSIPKFPNNSITIKPTYFIGKVSDGLIRIPAWQGPPANCGQVYNFPQWNAYVYADVKNGQPKGKIAIPVTDTATNIAQATVNLSDFIYYAIDSISASYINSQQQGQAGAVSAGDLVILVAMHVTTKEISNWTWQTFFWTCDPANPNFPSSPWHASLQPTAQLTGAASHYAVSTAYTMVWPNQPVTGGTNTGAKPVIGYNPYLEPGLQAPFNFPNKLNPAYQYGLQTNCMSCHALATSNTKNGFLGYTADQYIDMKDPVIFNGWVQLDFAWSIQANLNANK